MKTIGNKIRPFFLTGFFILSLFSCEKNNDSTNEECKKFTVSLIERDDYVIFEKSVMLFEDEKYLVKTPLKYFLSDLDNLFAVDYDGYLSTLEKIVTDGQNLDLLYASTYFNSNGLDFVLADFLENGHCFVFDKQNNNVILQILVEYWGCNSQLLDGAGGRKFYINDDLFLETTDWISKK
ncbi:MAG: hypothetical protein AB7S48_00760 [Bacteroidales bacterium]